MEQTVQSRGSSTFPDWAAYALIVVSVVLTAGLGSIATDPDSSWYTGLDRPEWQPASSVFAPVWTLLYALIAVSMIIAWRETDGDFRRSLFTLWGVNLILNLGWTVIFFQGQSALAAGIEILVLEATIVLLILRSWSFSRAAALLLVPYAAWVAFATALTWSIFAQN